ncbi:MAG: hypothetical protein ACFFKA_00015 [Candidatus Thorarchaeota archaeon]
MKNREKYRKQNKGFKVEKGVEYFSFITTDHTSELKVKGHQYRLNYFNYATNGGAGGFITEERSIFRVLV